MKAALYSPYLDTLGGGERYLGAIAQFLLKKGFVVDFLWDDPKILGKLSERFGLKISDARVIPGIVKKGIFNKWFVFHKYELSVFVSDGSIPLALAKKNYLHFQVPFILKNAKSLENRVKLNRFKAIICNSKFTKSYIDETYGVSSQVIYPPVDIKIFKALKKENIILSVGRFFGFLHSKKQDVLVEVFKKMVKGGLSDWRLILAGGADDKNYLKKLKKISSGYPIEIKPDAKLVELKKLYAKSKIFWHAAGFGEDLITHPQRAEHFGISTVEAMASGCVPAVYKAGGMLEIIEDNKSGLFWSGLDQLESQTKALVQDENKRKKFSKNAIIRSNLFSSEVFEESLSKLLNLKC